MTYRPDISLVLVLLVASFALLGSLWRLHRGDNPYDLAQLVSEPDGSRLSLSRLGQLVALVTSTWGFVALVQADRLTEWYYGAYMLAWAGTALATRVLGSRATATSADA